ncbi:hypothetical protein C3L33_09843, partial [Rhododendron williamsianum]
MGSDSEAEKTAQKVKEKKLLLALAPIAKPLAGKKLSKRIFKLVRRAAGQKCLKRGVKEVVKSIRRGNKGLCVIAGNISPIDVITHVPILCEESEIPYYSDIKRRSCECRSYQEADMLCSSSNQAGQGGASPGGTRKAEGEYDQVASDVSELAPLYEKKEIGCIPLTSSMSGDSFANWEEDVELGIIEPVNEPLFKPAMKREVGA